MLLSSVLGPLVWIGLASSRIARRVRARDDQLSRLALVASKTENAVLITDPEGLIQWINEGFTRITGHPHDDAIGKAPGAYLSGPVRNLHAIQSIRDAV